MIKTITKEVLISFIGRNDLELMSTQTRFCLPVINRLYKKLQGGIMFSGIKVANNLICDGHHRYVASMLANIPLERVPGNITSATRQVDWTSIIFEEDDWDTPAKINMLNEQDARFNDMSVEQIAEMIK